MRRNIALKLKDTAPQRSPSDGVRKKEGERGGGDLRFVARGAARVVTLFGVVRLERFPRDPSYVGECTKNRTPSVETTSSRD